MTEKVGTFLRKIERNLDDYGWSVTLTKTFAHLFGFVYFKQVYRVYRIDLSTSCASEYPRGKDYEFKVLTAQDANEIAQIERMAEWLRGNLQERLRAGCLCVVALHGEKVAGFNLISFGIGLLVLVNLRKKLRKGQAWSEHIGVRKGYRQTRLGSQLRYMVFELLRQKNIRWLYGGTLRSNYASLKLARAVGFEEFADIHYSKIFGAERWSYVRVKL